MRWMSILTLGLLVVTSCCQAFMLGTTRVVLRQDTGVAGVTMYNGKSHGPSIVKAMVQRSPLPTGNDRVSNFIVSPPVSRVEVNGSAALRIQLANTAGLPADRESAFYLKVVSMTASNPLARDRDDSSGAVKISTGSIINLFYRPTALQDPTVNTWLSMQFHRVPAGIQVNNPTPYYIIIKSLRVGGEELRSNRGNMVEPFGSKIYGKPKSASKQVKWTVLNDAGLVESGNAALQ